MQEVNVQVAIRIRPQVEREKIAHEICVRASNKQVLLGKDHSFTFDFVFSSNSEQKGIYENCVDSLVQSCFEGYNTTIFAYGQTGSGKTFTMGTTASFSCPPDQFGIIPRAIERIFQISEDYKENECIIKVSFLEIYKDELIDLLDINNVKEISIRDDPSGNTFVMGCLEVQCTSVDEVMNKLREGSLHRKISATRMNDQSSRSHTIFTIYIEQRQISEESSEIGVGDVGEKQQSCVCAKFHFVDLAGSERANRTGNVGERFKESIHINTGLLALGNVISALGESKKKSHIPYRDSKITRILKDSLGGNAKTLMICCVSPSVSDFDETLSSLKYASRARKIRNRPVVNHDPHTQQVEDLKSEISTLKDQLMKERTRIMSCGHVEDAEHFNEQFDQLKKDCSRYYEVAREAINHIKVIQEKAMLSHSVNGRLSDWLKIMDDLGKWNKSQIGEILTSETARKLQLEQREKDMISKEKIVNDQTLEMINLRECIKKLDEENSNLKAQLSQYKNKMEIHHASSLSIEEEKQVDDSNIFIGGRQRAKSVPFNDIRERRFSEVVSARDIHTSPACFTVEKIEHLMKLKNDFLFSQLEDDDEVLTHRGMEDSDEVLTHRDLGYNDECVDMIRNTDKRKTFRVNVEERSHPSFKSSIEKPGYKIEETVHKIEKWDENSQIILKNLMAVIKSKEQVIKQLLEKEKESSSMNISYQQRIKQLEENILRIQDMADQNVPKKSNIEKMQEKQVIRNSLSSMYKEPSLIKHQQSRNSFVNQPESGRLITAKMKTLTEDEMRSVAYASSNWIDEQIQAQLQEKINSEDLQKDIAAKNKLLLEKKELLSQKIMLEHRISTASQSHEPEVKTTTRNAMLLEECNKLSEEVSHLKNKQTDGLITSTDYQLLNEYEEELDALDATIKYRDEIISTKQEDLVTFKSKIKSHSYLCSKLKLLSQDEVIYLLIKFFEKVAELKNEIRKISFDCQHLQFSLHERNILVKDLELALSNLKIELGKNMTSQSGNLKSQMEKMIRKSSEHEASLKAKINALEKELFYYKSTCKVLKKKLKVNSELNPLSQEPEKNASVITELNGKYPTQQTSPERSINNTGSKMETKNKADRHLFDSLEIR